MPASPVPPVLRRRWGSSQPRRSFTDREPRQPTMPNPLIRSSCSSVHRCGSTRTAPVPPPTGTLASGHSSAPRAPSRRPRIRPRRTGCRPWWECGGGYAPSGTSRPLRRSRSLAIPSCQGTRPEPRDSVLRYETLRRQPNRVREMRANRPSRRGSGDVRLGGRIVSERASRRLMPPPDDRS